MTRKKFDDVPMFDVTPVAVEKHAAVKTVASALCPGHNGGYAKTGLVRNNNHLYWREHYIPTWSGGGARVCGLNANAA